MESEQRRKRKRFYRSNAYAKFLSLRSIVLSSSFFVFLLFVSSDRFTFHTASFHPVLRASSSPLSLLSSRLILDSSRNIRPPIIVEDLIVFPDHLLLFIVSDKIVDQSLECVYHSNDSVNPQVIAQRAFSFDEYQEQKSIVRCPLAPMNYSTTVSLKRTVDVADGDWSRQTMKSNGTVLYWDRLAYEAALDGNSVLVFVKGLNLRPHRESDPSHLICKFGFGNWENDQGFVFTGKAIRAAQEVVRCLLPRTIRNNPDKAQDVQMTVVHANDAVVPSVAIIHDLKPSKIIQGEKYELCACTMLWNQAFALREWIMYHAWLGVERWFIYDNNSDDGIEEVINELESKNYNISRHVWPWIKSQEAGFSHCALRSRSECKWVGFFDVDEFFFFPPQGGRQKVISGQNGLRSLLLNLSSSSTEIAEIRTDCHSFGPSGLSSHPLQGVTVGYTCRLQSTERHKSIVRPEALDISLLNIVHHFKLREGFVYFNVPETTAVINHYKYQAWETFKAKFYRRVSSYVVDWQEDQNKGSKDRAPGLGTEAVEPPDWRIRFCEVWDTGLRDYVLANFADAETRFLPWERSLA